ncbi:MAG: ATP-binding cassette domain-containing protein [Aliifodinibius sp.]|nr:ABC transporter ATP-binding protein [Fodinibius sp.]NIV13999.1 ATP-binding cassette domain-containing protein [Fodinibius sp.]NIY27842.1 ATP-binding cassette domain-containing protein [Fodinibius sp.]
MLINAIHKDEALLSVRDLTVNIDHWGKSFPVVDKVSFDLDHNQTFALIGESGSGKTMTALALMGLLPKSARIESGIIQYRGKTILPFGELSFHQLHGKHMVMIFQDPSAALNPVFSIGTQLSDVVKTHLNLTTMLARQHILDLFAKVGLPDPEWVYRAYPHQLSGGMAQRCMIALALSCNPQLIIADEPTSSLDVTTQMQILNLIRNLQNQHQFALLLISHNISLLYGLVDTVAVMKSGKILDMGTPGKILSYPSHQYTRKLVKATLYVPQPYVS